ncbi:MAG: PAS domain S-box protein [Nitrospirales bacterium]|nr:PAS domain S-box protein [Nitrospirales bacterium]
MAANPEKLDKMTRAELIRRIEELSVRLDEAEETLHAVRSGEVDALMVEGPKGLQVYTLQGAERPYRFFVESMNQGAVTTDRDGFIVYCNNRFTEIVRTPWKEIVTASFLEMVFPDQRKAVEEMMQGGKTQSEVFLIAGDGTIVPVLLSISTVENGENRYIAVTDLTERKRIEEELREHRDHLENMVRLRTSELEEANTRLLEMDRLKSVFIASMSHELRTPLNTIIGFSGIILQGLAGTLNAEQQKQLGIVKGSSLHLLSLINDIIDISKIETGKLDLYIRSFDLSTLVREVTGEYAGKAEEKGLEMIVHTPETLPIESDKRRTRQILVNLLDNAVKFTERGQIEVCLTITGGNAEISFSDTGIGIEAEDMGRLFRSFCQIVTKEIPKEGSGLGLYLSRKIARLLGGDISVQSEPGKGSVFTLALPAAELRQREI